MRRSKLKPIDNSILLFSGRDERAVYNYGKLDVKKPYGLEFYVTSDHATPVTDFNIRIQRTKLQGPSWRMGTRYADSKAT